MFCYSALAIFTALDRQCRAYAVRRYRDAVERAGA